MSSVAELKEKSHAAGALPGPLAFIGAGRVGTALASLLQARGVQVAAISGRTRESGLRLARLAGLDTSVVKERTQAVAGAALVFLTVPDDAIGTVCEEIAREGGWRPGQGVAHCSGSLPSTILQPARDAGALVASFHPLQAFASPEAAIAGMPGSTFALEGDPELMPQLEQLVHLLGGKPLKLSAEQKVIYHAAAVIASNYAVTLAALASELLARQGIAPDRNEALTYLLPLIKGTVGNLETLGLPYALTGPLVRGDVGTIARHLAALNASTPDLAHLYRHLARTTLPLAREKGRHSDDVVEELDRILDDGRQTTDDSSR